MNEIKANNDEFSDSVGFHIAPVHSVVGMTGSEIIVSEMVEVHILF